MKLQLFHLISVSALVGFAFTTPLCPQLTPFPVASEVLKLFFEFLSQYQAPVAASLPAAPLPAAPLPAAPLNLESLPAALSSVASLPAAQLPTAPLSFESLQAAELPMESLPAAPLPTVPLPTVPFRGWPINSGLFAPVNGFIGKDYLYNYSE
uniref:Actin cytoskeleton-regulatory complex protein PAN1-like isoform X2 n=1 Tax=Dermatophagoides pteronyssinus TaxID=6956 RepID=A0A6P6XPV4_DERPT|nr:actin cytoskeleton-regulatory complex protein PAN1-like isoform X2 [Dermatophagoides pteronyssinus]